MAADWANHGARISKVLGDRIKLGMASKHEDYVAALQLAEHCRGLIAKAFDGIDAIIAPCVKGEAIRCVSGIPAIPLSSSSGRCSTYRASSLPTHRGPTGLPVGIQVVAPRYADDTCSPAHAGSGSGSGGRENYPRCRPRRRGPITTAARKFSMVVHIVRTRRMGPRLRGDDKNSMGKIRRGDKAAKSKKNGSARKAGAERPN